MNYKLLSSQNYSFAACLLKIIFILPDSKVVFHASLVNNLPSPASPIIFDNISINEGFGFDTMLRSFFEVPQDGYYWLYLSVGIPFNKSCKCTINGQNISLSVFRTLAITGFDDIQKDPSAMPSFRPSHRPCISLRAIRFFFVGAEDFSTIVFPKKCCIL